MKGKGGASSTFLHWKVALERAEYAKETLNPDLSDLKDSATPPITLSPDQEHIIDLVVNKKKSLFFTGKAGTGKTFTLNEIIRRLSGVKGVYITASTGIAATHIEGTTVHSFGGTGIDMKKIEDVIVRVDRNKNARERWRDCSVLIIDEISMIDGEYFRGLETIARILRRDQRPFGGIQLVLTGDFLQLPPVTKKGETRQYLFETDTWKSCVQECVRLQRVFRQDESEAAFKDILQNVRLGCITDAQDALLRARVRHPLAKNGVDPTRLFTKRANVDEENERHLKRLDPATEKVFKSALEYRPGEKSTGDALARNCLAPNELRLRTGAQVMLLKNVKPPLLVNGSRGEVIGFQSEGECVPIVKFESGVTLAVPKENWSVVRGGSNKVASATYTQIPLCLAWAITTHKSQGMTLDKVELDIGECWEPGQAYVALSRCTSLKGISLLSYDRRKIKADAKVIRFYADLGDEDALEVMKKLDPSYTIAKQKEEDEDETHLKSPLKKQKATTLNENEEQEAVESAPPVNYSAWLSQWAFKR